MHAVKPINRYSFVRSLQMGALEILDGSPAATTSIEVPSAGDRLRRGSQDSAQGGDRAAPAEMRRWAPARRSGGRIKQKNGHSGE